MELKDYLPYYLGCDYWTNNSQGNLNAHTLPHVIDMCERNCGVQLHLRKLEDITPEEQGEMRLIRDSIDYRIKKHAAVTHYLLKQRFDLFSLIDANLAVNAKTVK